MTPRSPSPGRYYGAEQTAPWSGWARHLAEVPLFAGLSRRHLKKVAGLAGLRGYSDGKTLVRAGSLGDAFYVILDGRVRVETPAGRTRTLEAGEFFGELALVDGAPRSATVVALGDVSVARIPRPAFAELLREEPRIAVGLARGVVGIVRELEGDRGRPADASPGAPDEGVTETDVTRDAASLLAGVPLFAGLPKRHLRKVARVTEPRHYANGATVVRVGARGATFHVIVHGRAQALTPDGRARALHGGDYFGELSLLDGAPRTATVSAVEELTTLSVGRPAFLKLLSEEPTIAVGLVRGLVALVRELQRQEDE